MQRHLEGKKAHLRLKFHFGQRYKMVSSIAIYMILFGFSQNSIPEILSGLAKIVVSPDTLISDYIELGNMGAAFVNSGLLLLICTFMLFSMKLRLTGANLAGLFIIAGFGLFGKNILNVWFPILGVRLYAMYNKERFSHYIVAALFSTALAPVVSEIAFSQLGSPALAIPIGMASAVLLGFFLAPVGSALVNVHQGLCLYNMGFSAGLIATVLISTLKSYGFKPQAKMLWSTGNNEVLAAFLIPMFLACIVYGFFINGKSFKGYTDLVKLPGRLITDFLLMTSKGVTLINMGLMGILSTVYIILIGGDLNGPTVGAILTIFGFSAFGKHPLNTFPLVLGIVLASFTKIFAVNDPSIQLAALFSTALAPIAGEFGIFWGLVAGALHSSLVQYVGVLHGGLNLYNNGFSAGLVAAVLAPIIEAFRKERL